MMKEMTGDLIELAFQGKFDVIVHGANCFHTMGAGIAKQIKEQCPRAAEVDRQTTYGNIKKLGRISTAHIKRNNGTRFCVVNAYTQFKPGPNLCKESLEKCFHVLNNNKFFQQCRIGIPVIGCGIAGGDWEEVKEIIERSTPNLDITLVRYGD